MQVQLQVQMKIHVQVTYNISCVFQSWYKYFQKGAEGCKQAKVCKSMKKIQKFERVCKMIQNIKKIYVQKYLYKSFQKYPIVYKKNAKVFKSLQKYAMMCKSM